MSQTYHIKIDGVSWCQCSVPYDVNIRMGDLARTRLGTSKRFVMSCDSIDFSERENFKEVLEIYFPGRDVQIVKGPCNQRDEDNVDWD